MKKKLFENAIIIGGDVYELVKDYKKDSCSRCDLRDFCDNSVHYFCGSIHSDADGKYEYIGTVDEVIEKHEKRKLARHYMAVLTQQRRYRDAFLNRDVQIYKSPKASEMVEAEGFLIKELKEVFK